MKRIVWFLADLRGAAIAGAFVGLLLGLFMPAAKAEIVATMQAHDGSVLALFDDNDWCTQVEGQDAAAVDAGMTVRALGCWKREGSKIIIHWRGVGMRSHDVDRLEWRKRPQT